MSALLQRQAHGRGWRSTDGHSRKPNWLAQKNDRHRIGRVVAMSQNTRQPCEPGALSVAHGLRGSSVVHAQCDVLGVQARVLRLDLADRPVRGITDRLAIAI